MMHRQAYNLFCHLSRNRKILLSGTGKTTVGTEGADEGIEIAAAPDTLFLHLEIELVASYAVLLCIDKNGEVTVIMADAGISSKKRMPGTSLRASR